MKYIITGLSEGTYDSLNPITDGNLVEFGGAKPDTEISWSEINNKPTIPSVLNVLNSTRKDASLSADRGRALKELFDKLEAVLDIDEIINAVRNITLRNNGEVSSGMYMYDNPNTDLLYQFVRYNAASNFIEFGSKDGDVTEVVSAKVDRGKTDWEFQNRIQILKPGRGISLLTPSATSTDGNSSTNKYELTVNEGGVLELYEQNNDSLGALVWSSASGVDTATQNLSIGVNVDLDNIQAKQIHNTERIIKGTNTLTYNIQTGISDPFVVEFITDGGSLKFNEGAGVTIRSNSATNSVGTRAMAKLIKERGVEKFQLIVTPITAL